MGFIPKCCQLSQKTSFISMIVLTATFFLVEIIVGYLTNSMALVADSFHMLSDVVSLIVGYMALRYSRLGQQSGRYTFGWARAEVLGALVNAVFLAALCFSILVESLKRMILIEPIESPKLVLLTGTIGLVVNLIGLFLFHQHGHSHGGGGHGHSHGGGSHGHSHGGGSHGHSHNKKKKTHKVNENLENKPGTALLGAVVDSDSVHINTDANNSSIESQSPTPDIPSEASQLNIRGVYLHVLGDALGSVIVMISALIIMYENGKWTLYVDPVMSVLMVAIILKTSIPLLKESSMILMQTVPTHIKIKEIQTRLVEKVPSVLSVHEFHIWQLAGNRIIASAHVRCKTLADYMAIANQLKEFFHNEGIHSTTIQPEFVEQQESFDGSSEQFADSCVLECDEDCAERTCCGTTDARDLEKKSPSPKNANLDV